MRGPKHRDCGLILRLFYAPVIDRRIMVGCCLSVHMSKGLERSPFCSIVHNSFGQNIVKTMQTRLITLSMFTSYGKRKKPINFQGQRSKIT